MPGATSLADMLSFFMALPFFADSTPRAYRLKAGNADIPISTSFGTFPKTSAGKDSCRP
jgi:hypothetical protein